MQTILQKKMMILKMMFWMKNLMMTIDDFLRIAKESARPNTPDPITDDGTKVVLFLDEFERYSQELVRAAKSE